APRRRRQRQQDRRYRGLREVADVRAAQAAQRSKRRSAQTRDHGRPGHEPGSACSRRPRERGRFNFPRGVPIGRTPWQTGADHHRTNLYPNRCPGSKESTVKKRIHKSFRPALEGLETRLVPATIVVNTTADLLGAPPQVVSLREAIRRANLTA